MIGAYLFDLDGTLIDSEPWHKRSEIEAFKALGLEVDEEDLIPYMGNVLSVMLEGIGRAKGKVVDMDEFRVVGQPLLTQFIHDDMEAFADAREVVHSLSGVRRAIVTSSMKWYLDETSSKFEWLSSQFDVRVCQADVANGKPHPEPFLLAASRLEVEPGRCVAVEDSVNGVRAALAAGCTVVGIDREGHGRLREAHVVLSSLADLQGVPLASQASQ